MSEIWKEIKNFEGFYEVSNYGNVRSVSRLVKCRGGKLKQWNGKLLNTQDQANSSNKFGAYKAVVLSKEGKATRITVHQLVAEAFLPNFSRGMAINHIDGNPTNNHISNLEISNSSHN